jgi:RNA polymerase sigma-70 factor (ECF subfamily)
MQTVLPSFVFHTQRPRDDSGEDTAGADSSAPVNEVSDEELMLAFVGGNRGSFSELFQRYKQPLFGFFRRRIYEQAQAEELTQETFLAVLRGSSRYRAEALFRTYLYAIAFKLLHAYRRKTAFRAAFLGSAETGKELAERSSILEDMQVRQALKRLEAIDREVLMLREFEQLSYAEIAELLKLPVNTVRTRIFRARVALRDVLAAPAVPGEGVGMRKAEGLL